MGTILKRDSNDMLKRASDIKAIGMDDDYQK